MLRSHATVEAKLMSESERRRWLQPSANWLLLFVPLAIAVDRLPGISPPLVFFAAALAIIPVARLIGQGTEHLASYTGDAVGGLLNATFGNLPELIITVVALKAGLHAMVAASLVGAILFNLLLVSAEAKRRRTRRIGAWGGAWPSWWLHRSRPLS
jgi:Ca2+:H+ antiporter